jgi:hypothetical protein
MLAPRYWVKREKENHIDEPSARVGAVNSALRQAPFQQYQKAFMEFHSVRKPFFPFCDFLAAGVGKCN